TTSRFACRIRHGSGRRLFLRASPIRRRQREASEKNYEVQDKNDRLLDDHPANRDGDPGGRHGRSGAWASNDSFGTACCRDRHPPRLPGLPAYDPRFLEGARRNRYSRAASSSPQGMGLCGIVFELTGAAASYVLHGVNARELASPLVFAAFAVASWALRPPDRILGTLLPERAVA